MSDVLVESIDSLSVNEQNYISHTCSCGQAE